MTRIERTTSENRDFRELILSLDAELTEMYGEVQEQYSRFNNVDMIGTVVIAYAGGQPVGCGCFRPMESDAAEIKRMFVSPEFRGKGISKLILSELERWASENGFARTVLETGKKQLEAVGLYHRMGYTDIPNYGQYEDDENSICMEKNLK
jgi:putative acetyltransferase